MILRILAARLKKRHDNTTNEPYYTLIILCTNYTEKH
jgi:hypothetical protein